MEKEKKGIRRGEDLREHILSMVKNIIENAVEVYTMQSKYPEEWDMLGLENHLENIYLPKGALVIEDIYSLNKENLVTKLYDIAVERYEAKENEIGKEMFREIERVILLQVVDSKWMDHIDAMDQLRQGIGLRLMAKKTQLGLIK